jgi:hypothetical protein
MRYGKLVKYFVGKLEGNRSLERSRCRKENNIKMDLRETGCVSIGFIWLRIKSSGGLL